MFKKIVSGLPFSPALIGQLGFYARRLRKEEATRRLGLVFTALAIAVQSLAVISPPEAQAAASGQNVIYQGVKDKNDLLRIYDANVDSVGHRDIQAIYNKFGITRNDIVRANPGTFNSRSFNLGIQSVGRNSYDAGTPYEKAYSVTSSNGSSSNVFARKLYRFDKLEYTKKNGSNYKGVIGTRADGSWFAISFDCGNPAFVTIPQPPPPPPPAPAAACTGLQVLAVSGSRTKFTLKGSATAANGAKISRYDFTVTDRSGKSVASKQVASTAASAQTEVEIAQDGDHTAKVTVQTSVGAKTGAACEKPLKVTPEPRCPTNVNYPVSSPECKPCPYNPNIWYKDEKCQPPVAVCKGIKVLAVEGTRTRFTLKGEATATGGATISRYDFVVTDKSGKAVKNAQVATTENTAQTEVDIAQDGDYTAKLTVQTSQGAKSGADCSAPLKVTPEPRCPTNVMYPANSPECKPCPYDSTVWYKDAKCRPEIKMNKRVSNLTQKLNDANNSTAKPGDRLEYNLTVTNGGKAIGKQAIKENMSDALEYADFISATDGYKLDPVGNSTAGTRNIAWNEESIKPGQTMTKSIIVQVKKALPASSQNAGNPESFNCIMTNSFGSTTNVKMECPPPKIVENTVKQLPSTGPGENMLFGGILLMVVTYFYARARQLGKEVKLVRKEFADGTI